MGDASICAVGWEAVASRIVAGSPRLVVVEVFPGVSDEDTRELVRRLGAGAVFETSDALLPPEQVDALVLPELTDDRVFGKLSRLQMRDFFDPGKLARLAQQVASEAGRVVVVGPGASLVARGDVTVLAEMPRWETQLRQRRGEVGNLGAANQGEGASQLYKRSYFIDWRVCDRHKKARWADFDHFLDSTIPSSPRLISRDAMERALDVVASRPFRVVPYFDPAPWGGEWMRRVCELDPRPPNFGWCFDCVPEENSLLLDFDGNQFETPAANLVFQRPRQLLGETVERRFGAEFPIRFDFLDTMGGGNLSLQVHPLTAYIREHFGVRYTQDESYYMLDAAPEGSVFLGLREGVDRERFAADLRRAEAGEISFPADEYVNKFPARRHDHFLIPAGTIHCSGAGGMVLEISATPYIFTFKLWDWDRLGLDGLPRPINVEHGLRNIQWDRDTNFALRELVNHVVPVAEGPGWSEERTGLHPTEFIETRRHWFTGTAPHPHDDAGVNVLNLVEGTEAIVESPDNAFSPYVVHYAETFIVPAAAGPYAIRPSGDRAVAGHATIKAFVRTATA
ncbi:MAG: class I mannose-6-phosphate isomerase [Candidatus Dormibacteria bacterium]